MKHSFFSFRLFLIWLILLCAALFAQPAHSQTASGVSSDGKDFYIGFVNPSYNTVANPVVRAFFGVFALVSSYTNNTIRVTYFDSATGVETKPQIYKIPARTGIQVALDTNRMRMNPNGDRAEYTACHITADQPVNIQYFSYGACAGGSYLSLATPALGKKYVIDSYQNNPGELGIECGEFPPPGVEDSHGFFEIIAAFDNTFVTIIPNATTIGGHIGTHSGTGANYLENPYKIILRRGQCYLVKSAGDNTDVDISGSIVESDKPIAVLAGHENAAIGGVSNRQLEGRDFMVEQMIPVDFWDTTGYVSIPLKDSQPADPTTFDGVGENYRMFSWDSTAAKINFFDACTSGELDMTSARLLFPAPERESITCPVDIEGVNGIKFSAMMYDQRNFANAPPYPAPSMMTIIPISRWKTSYMWFVPQNKFENSQAYFVNIIAPPGDFDGTNGILVSFNGGQIRPVKTVIGNEQLFRNIPNHIEGSDTLPLYGLRFKVSPGSYYATSPHPFIVYNYGFRALDPNYDLGDFDCDDYFFSYANPTGASLSSGNPGKFGFTIDSQCTKWNICVHDLRTSNRGIRSVTLLNDSLGIQFSPGKQSVNCHFDSSFDPNNYGEVEFPGTDSVVCFSVLVFNPIQSGYAAVLVTDNAGNKQVADLHYEPAKLSITPGIIPINLSNISVGTDSCFSVILKNNEILPHVITAANLTQGKSFSVSSVQPKLPFSLAPNDSIILKICFTSHDTAHVFDTLLLHADCISIPVQLSGSGGVGLISASDLNFGKAGIADTICRSVSIHNVGTKPFTLTKNWALKGSAAFTFSDSGLLPFVFQPGERIKFTFCYSPSKLGNDTATIQWNTDISSPFTQSVKSYSTLTGEGVIVSWDRSQENDTVICDDTDNVTLYIINFNPPGGAPGHVDSVFLNGPNASDWYILNDQLGILPLKNFNLNPGDSIWVDLVFKPDLNKPLALRYADRQANLVAKIAGDNDQVINLTGSILHAVSHLVGDTLDFGNVSLGAPITRSLLLQNLGDAALIVAGFFPITSPFVSLSGIAPGTILPPHDTIGVLIQITMALDHYTDTTIILAFAFDKSCTDTQFVKLHIAAIKNSVEVIQPYKLLSLRPNPANGNSIILTFDALAENTEVSIFDVLGREMYKRNVIPQSSQTQIELPIGNLQNGVYYARVTLNGRVITEKFEVLR